MTDEFSNDLLSAYFDEELSLDERAEVERKLHADPSHREEIEQFSRLSKLLGSLNDQSAPEDLRVAVLHQIERESLLGTSLPSQPAKEPSIPKRGNYLFVAGILLVASASILIAIGFLGDGNEQPVPKGVERPGKNRIAKNKEKKKKEKKTAIPKTEEKKPPRDPIFAKKPTRTNKTIKKKSPIPLQWDEIIASLDYSNNKTSVIELHADDENELLRKIQKILTSGNISVTKKEATSKSTPSGVQAVYFEGSPQQLKETLKKLTKETWWKEPTLRESVDPLKVQLAKATRTKPKAERIGIQSFSVAQRETLSQKIAQVRQKLQAKKKGSSGSGAGIQSFTVKPKTKIKPQQFQLPVQLDKDAWEKTRPKEIEPEAKSKKNSKAPRILRILIVIGKRDKGTSKQ